MKNKHMEYLKSNWKNSKHGTPNKDGVIIYHVYETPKKYSWWDDFGFYINGVYHAVWWVHPRMKYSDIVENMAHKSVNYLYPDRHSDWLSGGIKNYKKVGKSRKKLVSTTMGKSKDAFNLWSDAYRSKVSELLVDNEIVVTPSIKTTWLGYGKGIDICYPVELLNEQDVIEFAAKLRESIVSGKPLNFGNYAYTKYDWIAEGHEGYHLGAAGTVITTCRSPSACK